MSKMLNISLIDAESLLGKPFYDANWSTLSEEECSNILQAMNFQCPSQEDVCHAINVLLAYFYYAKKGGTYINVDSINDRMTPPKE